MSDTVAIALIAVAGTLGSGLLSYLAAQRSSEVQLVGVKAEMERLRESHAEEYRRERQETYHAFIDVLQRVRQLAIGLTGPATDEAYLEIVSQFATAHMNVAFLGEKSVFEPMDQMLEIFQEFTTLVSEDKDSESLQKKLSGAFAQMVDRWNEGEGDLRNAMKYDITRARQAEEKLL